MSIVPMVPGTGGVGIIRSLGPGNTILQVGQMVVLDPTIRARDNPIAPDTIMLGLFAAGPGGHSIHSVWQNGTWAEKVVAPVEIRKRRERERYIRMVVDMTFDE